ncbi:MAG: hypothetical protein ILO34_08645, partial [Kiritimatiellae bacterium]|nr:hypothetical protein [Kiritimatiellia bacterium]
DFCREVVSEKRLAMSPEELLHAMEMVGEVGPAKVAQDGRLASRSSCAIVKPWQVSAEKFLKIPPCGVVSESV